MKWLLAIHRSAPAPAGGDDARAALTKSVDDLLGSVQLRDEARHVAERHAAVVRRNHLAESVRHSFRESR
jgi:hypothetical protein